MQHAVMKSPWHRDTPGALQALRSHGLLATAPARGRQPTPQSARRPSHSLRRAAWLPRIAGLLAFSALALGAMLAGSETCTAQETAATGSYRHSTLALAAGSRADAAAAQRRPGGCRHRHNAGRFAYPKAAA